MNNGAFISYRRQVSWATAELIYKNLKRRRIDVYMDLNNLGSGQFDNALLKEIENRPYFLIILEHGSLDRCTEPNDWVLRELEHAWKRKRIIIPIWTPNFSFSEAKSFLPEPLASELPRFNGVDLPYGHFRNAMKRLHHEFLKPTEIPNSIDNIADEDYESISPDAARPPRLPIKPVSNNGNLRQNELYDWLAQLTDIRSRYIRFSRGNQNPNPDEHERIISSAQGVLIKASRYDSERCPDEILKMEIPMHASEEQLQHFKAIHMKYRDRFRYIAQIWLTVNQVAKKDNPSEAIIWGEYEERNIKAFDYGISRIDAMINESGNSSSTQNGNYTGNSETTPIPLPKNGISEFKGLKLETQFDLNSAPSGSEINLLTFSPDGTLLVAGLNKDRVAVWDSATGQLKNSDAPKRSARLAELQNWPTRSIALSHDSLLLSTTSEDKAIQIWHLLGLKPHKVLDTVNHIAMCLDFSSDGQWLAAGLATDGYIYTWSLYDNFRSVDHVKAHNASVRDLKFHPNKSNFVSCSEDGTINYWRIVEEEIKSIRSFEGHDGEHVVCTEFSPDGRLLASGSVSGQIHIWEVETGQSVSEIKQETVIRTLKFSPDGRLLASGSNDNTLKIWDVASGRNLLSKKFAAAVKTVAFSPDGSVLATSDANSKIAQIWRVL